MARSKLPSSWLVLWLCSLAASAGAQPAPDAELPPAPPPPPAAAPAAPVPEGAASAPALSGAVSTQPAPAPTPAPTAPAAAAPACVPACRSGYLCERGQCLSACNPPCPQGQHCNGHGECVAEPAAPALPPSIFPSGPVAPIPRPPGAERHDGFMLRLALGFGGASLKEKVSGSTLGISNEQFSGLSGSFSLDVGGALSDEIVLHGRLSDFVMVDPNVKVDGVSTGTATDSSLAALLLAPAVSYYFMPVNVYLTGAVGLSWLSIKDPSGDSASTSAGFGLNFDVGKEWWVSDDWGLGVAGRFWFSHVATKNNSSPTATVKYTDDFIAAGVLFSATYQ